MVPKCTELQGGVGIVFNYNRQSNHSSTVTLTTKEEGFIFTVMGHGIV